MVKMLIVLSSILLITCKPKIEKIKPVEASISESVYASGIIKSKNQYQAFVTVNGIIEKVFVSEGDSVKRGEVLISMNNKTQRLNAENAKLAFDYASVSANQGKLKEAALNVDLCRRKMKNDSLLFVRQAALWNQNIGSKIEFEQRDLNYQNSKNNYFSALINKQDLDRQVSFNASQVQKNLFISRQFEDDFLLRSEIDGIIYSVLKNKGEIVTPQTPIIILGSGKDFILEMQVDEYDIMKIKIGLAILVTMDSYKGKVFEAIITKIDPFMNSRNKTFIVEAQFTNPPSRIYPNITFEASIVLHSKTKALLIPRPYLLNDSQVIRSNKDTVTIKTGLKDYQKVEVLSGLNANDELIKPLQ
jgi:HlyD family secretion protein